MSAKTWKAVYDEGKRDGQRWAIEALRDQQRYEAWCVATHQRARFHEGTLRHFVDYLVTAAAVQTPTQPRQGGRS